MDIRYCSMEQWLGRIKKMPHLNFKKKWNVTILPSRDGILIRFLIEYNNVKIEVLLERDYCNVPLVADFYWVAYNEAKFINQRFSLNKTKKLLKWIKKELKAQKD